MKIRVAKDSFKGCPPSEKSAGFSDESIMHIHVGNEHDVYAISFFSGIVFYLIIDDLDMFTWLPAWLFEIIDHQLSYNWIINTFSDEPRLIIGPKLITDSIDLYNRFVEQDPELISSMKEFIKVK